MVKRVKDFVKRNKESFGLFILSASIYFLLQLKTIYGGDSGDFAAAASVWGIPHPPSYPLYTFFAAILSNFFSFSTTAYRIGFLSTIPAVFSVVILYKLLNLFISKKVALLSSVFYAFLYPIWLYSEVVEVFALNNLFIILSTYLLFLVAIKKKKCLFNYFFLIIGLSISHHHTFIFLVPAFFYVFRRYELFKKIKIKHFVFLSVGLLPYLYLPISVSFDPAINYGDPSTFKKFLNVFLRRNYGTFWANPGINNTIIGRLLSLLATLQFIWEDFSFLGAFFILLSIYLIIKKTLKKGGKLKRKKDIFHVYSIIAFISFIILIVYASFPLDNDFNVATFERFLLAPYIFAVILIGFSLEWTFKTVKKSKKLTSPKIISNVIFIFLIIFMPLIHFYKNYQRISTLQNDFTAEKYARDTLKSVKEKGIYLGQGDVSFFTVAYLHFSEGFKRNKITFISSQLDFKSYQNYLKKSFSYLEINPENKDKYYWSDFVKDNYDKVPIYTQPESKLDGFELIPVGLTYRYYKEEDIPSVEEVINKNEKLWQSFNNPLEGSLSSYKHLFLTVYHQFYLRSGLDLAEYLVEKGKYQEAQKYLDKVKNDYQYENAQLKLLYGRIYLEEKECQKAEQIFLSLKEEIPDNPFPDAYLRQVYINCYEDEQRAEEFLDSCLQKESESELKLDEL